MDALFRNSTVKKLDVDGNAESIFYALDESESYVMGMNRSISSSMRINFRENWADNVSFYVKPDAHMIPPHELTDDMKKLSGFQWRISERPSIDQVIRKRPVPSSPPPEKPSMPPQLENIEQ